MKKQWLVAAILLIMLFVQGCYEKNNLTYIDFNKTNVPDNGSIDNIGKKSNVVRIGMVSRMGLEKDIFDFTPVCKILAQKTGLQFEIRWYRSSFELNEQLPFNSSDIIISPASSFLWEKRDSNLEPQLGSVLLKPVKGVVIVPKESGVQKIEELYDGNFAVVDPISNSEGLYVAYILTTLNQNLDVFFGSFFSTFNNRNAIQMVAANKVAGAAVEDIALDRLFSEDPSLREKIRVIYTGPQTKGHIVALRKSMDPALKEKIKKAMLDMSQDEAAAEALDKINLKGFKPVNQEDYRQMIEVIRTVRE